jgi:hypothetical protein
VLKLRKIKQTEFMETFFSPFIFEDLTYDPEKPNAKEKEEIKNIFYMISKRRKEIDRFTDLYTNSTSKDDVKVYVDLVKKNTQVIWHLKAKINTVLETKGLTVQDMVEYVDSDNLRNFNIDAMELDVALSYQEISDEA